MRDRCAAVLAALLHFAGNVAEAESLDHAELVPQLPRVSGAIVVDGVLDDTLWSDALRVRVDTETRPGENIDARVETTALLMENGEHLYVAFHAKDPDPGKIRAYLRDRDSAYQDDFVGIVLDTFNDERLGFEFFVNPLGVQMDLKNDDVNETEDDSWDAIWDSAGQITAEGYVVEMEIPFSQLRFPHLNGMQTWGIDLLRMYPRDHRYRIGSNPMDRNLNCYLCQFSKLQGLGDAEPATDLEVVPTLTVTQSAARDDSLSGPLRSDDPDGEPGVSIRWGITPDLTANLALNPDFSQVEADVAQLEVNNQFALFFPEKRPFFLDGADYFTTPIDAVFTRTVADPDIGAKLSGKRGHNTFGFFVADDRVTNLLFPGAFGSDRESLAIDSQALVARYSRSFGDVSSIGALVTGRRADDYENLVGGIDGRWKLNDQHSVQAQLLRSRTEYPEAVAAQFDQPAESFAGNAIRVSYDYDSRNWSASASHESFDPDFRADSGFVTRVDYRKQELGLGYTWHGDSSNWWNRLDLNANWDITHDDNGRLLEKELESYFTVQGPLQSVLEIGGLTRKVLFDDVLFQEGKLSVYAEIGPMNGVYLELWTRVGDQIDFANTRLGDELRMEPALDWNINRHLLLRLQSTLVRLDSKEGPNIFDASVHDVRLTWQFSLRSFLRLTVQHQDVERNQDLHIEAVDERRRDVGRQLLYSYKINPQTVFFLGYSDKLLDDDLNAMTTTDRTVFMKIGYAWFP